MPRIRSVKPEYWLDRKLAKNVSRDARLLYIGLWNYADEHGRLHGDEAVIKGQVFPYDDDITLPVITGLLAELAELGRVVVYTYEGDPYLFLPTLGKHQRLEPAKAKSRLPDPPSPDDTPSSKAHSEKTVAESEPNAAQSEPIVVQQVAGSRGQGASGREHGACSSGTRELRAALSRTGCAVAWDPSETDVKLIDDAIRRCGIPALVKHATSRHQRDNPAFSVRAFVKGWASMTGKAPPLELVPDPCEHGFDQRSKCATCRYAASA